MKKRITALALTATFAILVHGCTSASRGPVAGGADGLPTARQSPSGPIVQRHGFAVQDFRAVRDEYDQVSVIGEIQNTGLAARGVELQATLRNAAGRALAVGHFCPASYRNIEPGETWPFSYSFGRQSEAVQAELRIVGAFHTMDAYNVTPGVFE